MHSKENEYLYVSKFLFIIIYEKNILTLTWLYVNASTFSEMTSHLQKSEILIARTSTEQLIAGSVFVNPFFEDSVGELGMLCVDEKFLRKGLGKLLVCAAEDYCKVEGNCKQMRLELLTPTAFAHPVKTWLEKWYISLGYVKGSPENFAENYPRIAPLLAMECEFTVYLKNIDNKESF